jgi:hypothetical protein
MDLKFKNNAFFFSILPEMGGLTPMLIPRISNPNFLDKETFKIKSAPGIKQLLDGDLGITELIMMKVLDPIFSTLTNNPLVAEVFANQASPLDTTNSDVVTKAKAVMLENYIPTDNGLKALEKTIITTMMESHKPLFDFAKILMEMLGIAEDVVCRFLGTSIKVLGKQIGFPSRNPKYWSKEFGYAQTMTYSLRDFEAAFKIASNEFIKKMSDTHPLKGFDDQSTNKVEDGDNRDAIYIGYFDENGNEVEPPAWVLNSNKWFKKDILDSNGNTITVGAPFKRLSVEQKKGSEQIRQYHINAITKLEKQKEEILSSLSKEMELKSIDDIQHIEVMKAETIKEFDSLIQTVRDIVDGTNVNDDNYVDDEDKTKGVNTPVVLSEWLSKTRGSQLRQKYFPEMVSTVQSLVDKKGKPVEPYTYIPTVKVDYKGMLLDVETPLAYDKQISRKKETGDDFYYDKREGTIINAYSYRNIINNYDIYFNTSKINPYKDHERTWFKHNKKEIYLPDALKCYYLPIEWEEVLEYDIRNKETGEVLRKEYEVTSKKIDIENDYEIRVIRVVNRPLPLSTNEKLDNISKELTIDPKIGTIKNKGNNIPEALRQEANGKTPITNLHSTPDINEKNSLKEGVIYHGLDPRFLTKKNFFLVEALKKNVNGIACINGKYNDNDLANAENDGEDDKGKKWYGLLDKYTAFPMIATKLLPLIGGKLIPLIIEIIQLIQNPGKIKQMLLDLALDKKISKFPVIFKDFDKDRGVIGKVRKLKESGYKVPTNFDQHYNQKRDKAYYAGVQFDKKYAEIISMIDGQAVAEFGKGIFKNPLFTFGVNINITNISKPIEFISKRLDSVKEQPIITMILNFIKMPFEVIFKIFMWVIKWVKKLLNPIKIPGAIKEFISFKWLFDILGKNGLFSILGMLEPNVDFIKKLLNGVKNKEILRDVMNTIHGRSDLVEVSVFDILQNGIKIATEIEERDIINFDTQTTTSATGTGTTEPSSKDKPKLNVSELLAGLSGLLKGLCGERNFSLNDLLPIPLLSEMPKYNLCELPLIFLKPLEMIGGILQIIQELLNSLISMPLAIFGLEPHIKIPKLRFYESYAEMLIELRNTLTPAIISG